MIITSLFCKHLFFEIHKKTDQDPITFIDNGQFIFKSRVLMNKSIDWVYTFCQKLLQFDDTIKNDYIHEYMVLKNWINHNFRHTLHSGVEMGILMCLITRTFPNPQPWLAFDLVPGIGKTWQINNLFTLLELCVTTPTAQSASVYTSGQDVLTVHSRFKIDPNEKNYNKVNIHTIRCRGKPRIFVFDEYSMIPDWILSKVFKFLTQTVPNVCIILVGDSSQLSPPMGRQFKVHPKMVINRQTFSFCQFAAASDSIVFRFEGCVNADLFKEYLFKLKDLIEMYANNKKLSVKLDSREHFSYWLNFFSIFSTHRETITSCDTVNKIVERTRKNLTHIAAEEYDRVERIPLLIGYKNCFNFDLQQSVYTKLDGGECFIELNGENASDLIHNNFTTFIIPERALSHISLTPCLKSLSSTNILNTRNCFTLGASIRCKRNCARQHCINGDTGILVKIRITTNSNSFKKHIVDGKYIVTTIDDNCYIVVKMDYVNLKTNRLDTYTAVSHPLCENCSDAKCGCCGEVGICGLVLFWQTNYSCTLYNLQGQTLTTDHIYLETKHIMSNNKLRSLYIAISRVCDPKQIHIDVDFVLEGLRGIYKQKVTSVVFLKRIGVFLKTDSVHDTISQLVAVSSCE